MKLHFWLCLYAIAYLLALVTASVVTGTFISKTFKINEDVYNSGSQLEMHQAFTQVMCYFRCVTTDGCLSVNYRSGGQCELFGDLPDPAMLMAESGALYYGKIQLLPTISL